MIFTVETENENHCTIARKRRAIASTQLMASNWLQPINYKIAIANSKQWTHAYTHIMLVCTTICNMHSCTSVHFESFEIHLIFGMYFFALRPVFRRPPILHLPIRFNDMNSTNRLNADFCFGCCKRVLGTSYACRTNPIVGLGEKNTKEENKNGKIFQWCMV